MCITASVQLHQYKTDNRISEAPISYSWCDWRLVIGGVSSRLRPLVSIGQESAEILSPSERDQTEKNTPFFSKHSHLT